jgi:serine/threonine-protein kinase
MNRIGVYEIVGELGRGGMGVVYLARQPSLDRLVAIKVLAVDDAAMAERLENEARRLADLRHPNIVTVIDVGREEGQPYFVMTYCGGGTLAGVLERDGRLSAGQTAGVLASVAEALAEVHGHGLVHRDVKPSNVLLSEGGQPYLGDLGIAVDSGVDHPTTTGAVLGTIGYTAPEIIEGGKVTPAADVFGLGVLGYQLLVGEQPYRGAHIAAVMDAVRAGRRRSLPEAAVDAPPALCELIEQALSTAPGDRPSDLEAWARALRDAARPEPLTPVAQPEVTGATVHSGRPGMVASSPVLPSPPPSAAERARAGRSHRSPVLLVAGAVAAVVLLVAGVVLFGRSADTPELAATSHRAAAVQRTLPVRQGSDGVTVTERWTLRGGTLRSDVVAENTSTTEVASQLDVIVPKDVAATVGDVSWGTDPTSIVQDDPIVRYCLTLAPGATWRVSWSVAGLDDADAAAVDRWTSAWEQQLRAHVADPGGDPCPGATPTEVTLTQAPAADAAELAGGADLGSASGSAGGATTGGLAPTGAVAPSESGGTGAAGGSASGGSAAPTTTSTTEPNAAPSPSGGGTSTATPSPTPSPSSDPPPTQTPTPTPEPDQTSTATQTPSPKPDSCNGGDFSGNAYDGSCGNAPPTASDDTGSSIGFGANESGTKCWSPLVVNPLSNDTDREGSGLSAVWAGNARDSAGGQLQLGGSVVVSFNSSGNPKICMTRSYATGKSWIKIDYRARDTGGAESNVATITIPVFVRT